MSPLLSWLPPLVWMAVILVFSSDAFSGAQTGGVLAPLLRWLVPSITGAQIEIVHALIRKTAHFTEYGILAGLWLRTLVRKRVLALPAAAWVAFALTVAWACVDELHQSTVASRTGSAVDVAIDTAGAAVVLIGARVAARWNARGTVAA